MDTSAHLYNDDSIYSEHISTVAPPVPTPPIAQSSPHVAMSAAHPNPTVTATVRSAAPPIRRRRARHPAILSNMAQAAYAEAAAAVDAQRGSGSGSGEGELAPSDEMVLPLPLPMPTTSSSSSSRGGTVCSAGSTAQVTEQIQQLLPPPRQQQEQMMQNRQNSKNALRSRATRREYERILAREVEKKAKAVRRLEDDVRAAKEEATVLRQRRLRPSVEAASGMHHTNS